MKIADLGHQHPFLGSWDVVSLRRRHPDFLEMEVSTVMGVPPNHPSHLTITHNLGILVFKSIVTGIPHDFGESSVASFAKGIGPYWN